MGRNGTRRIRILDVVTKTDSTVQGEIGTNADTASSGDYGQSTQVRDGIAGVLGAGIALATTELVAGFAKRVPSMIESIGEAVIDLSPSTMVKFGITTFGDNDKPALAVGIVVISLVAGAFLGRGSRSKPWLPPAAMSIPAVVGVAATIRDPLASGWWALVPAVAAVIAGTFAIRYMLALAIVGTERRTTAEDRRRFILNAAGGLSVIVLAPIIGRRLARRYSVEAARAEVVLPPIPASATLPPTTTTAAAEVTATEAVVRQASSIEGLTPLYVPNDDFFRIDTAFTVPQVDPASWSLRITGMVDQELTFTYDELLERSTTEADVTLSCVSNRVGGDLVGNARWRGVPLGDLLAEAGVQPGGTQVMGRSVDNFSAGFPTSFVNDGRTALVAVAMNGEPLPTIHGFPARLVVAGVYGYVSATKWLSEIEINDFETDHGYWIPRGWSKEGPIKLQSRIDVPRQGVTAGTVTIAGIAWAPTRGISRVEIRIEDGPWVEATLGVDIGDESWVQWWHDVELQSGKYQVTVRATDGTGAVQTDLVATPAPNGASGHHSRRISVA